MPKNKTSINGTKMTQVKMYDFNENPIANLNDEKIIQKSYEKLPVISQSSYFKNGSSLFFSDSTNNILDPFETSSQNFTNSSSNRLNSNSTFIQIQRNERAMEPFVFNRNQMFPHKKSKESKNNFKPIEKKPKIPNLSKLSSQSIDSAYVANGLNSASNEYINQSTLLQSTKTKQHGNIIKQATPTYQHIDPKTKDNKQYYLNLTNHNYFSSSNDKFQLEHSQISNLSENISDKIHKIIRNYPSISSRRMERGKKPLPKLENYLKNNNIKYDIAQEPIQNAQKIVHANHQRKNHNQITTTNSNLNISTSTDLPSDQSKVFTHEGNSSTHLEASLYYDINQSISNEKKTDYET
jgi:hypothetical protein